jgi:hypothetical protein
VAPASALQAKSKGVVMLLAACLTISNIVNLATDARNNDIPEAEIRILIQEKYSGEERIRGFGVINLVYSLPKNSDKYLVYQHISLNCNNGEVIHGYQYPTKRARGGKGSRSRDEFHR